MGHNNSFNLLNRYISYTQRVSLLQKTRQKLMLKPFIKGLLSVQELSICLKQLIKESFPFVAVYGEISNLKTINNITYFTLKDSASQIVVVVFYSPHKQPSISEGESIIVEGRIDLYIASGRYQIIARNIKKIGIGLLQQRFELLKTKLKEEGLFDSKNKLKLPKLPKNIGLITSKDSAAFHDFISILQRNQWKGNITLIPSLVQGNAAPQSLIRAFKKANTTPNIDIIVLIRGGGSFEDLNCFNDEKLIRTLTRRIKPLITGIGHEIDLTLCDFISDYRAETPTAAAKFISDNYKNAQNELTNTITRLKQYFHFQLDSKTQTFLTLKTKLLNSHPKKEYKNAVSTCLNLSKQLQTSYRQQFTEKQNQYSLLKAHFSNLPILFTLERKTSSLIHLQQLLHSQFERYYRSLNERHCQLSQRLKSLSIQRQLQRGLLIPLNNTGEHPHSLPSLNTKEGVINVLHISGKYQVKVVKKLDYT